MNYTIGMKLRYLPESKFENPEVVEVVGIRKKGAKLSNGWVADEHGYVEGTKMRPGGKVEPIEK